MEQATAAEARGTPPMSDLSVSPAQMGRIEPYFALSHAMARIDDRPVVSGIIIVIRNGLRRRDAPTDYGPLKTIIGHGAGSQCIELSRVGFGQTASNRGQSSLD